MLSLFCISNLSLGQTKESSLAELLNLKSYQKDKSAEAIIIFDYGETKFVESDNGFDLIFHRKYRIKILSEAGLSYTKISIPLYTSEMKTERVDDFKAIAYNIVNEGYKATTTDDKQMFEEKINENWMQEKIAIAGVKVGSVIDVEYSVYSPFIFNLHDWEFQYEIPVIYSEYKTSMIPFYTYEYILVGTGRFDESDNYIDRSTRSFMGIEYKTKVFRFAMNNVPAFKDDSFISSPSDYMMKMDFQLCKIYTTTGVTIDVISTWEKISKELLKHNDFGRYIKASKKYSKKILEQMELTTLSDEDKLEKIVTYIKQGYNWNGHYGEYAQKTAKEFKNEKIGNTGNINLFLTGMIQEAGLEAVPVILSTRDHGKIYYDYPFTHFFNYVVVLTKINNKYILIDATEKNTTIDQLPYRCINENGLVIQKDSIKWVPLTSNKTTIEAHNFSFKFNPLHDTLICNYSYNADGYKAIEEKNNYGSDPKEYLANKGKKLFDVISETNLLTDKQSKTFQYEINGSNKSNTIDNYYTIKPFLSVPFTENPFKNKTRQYPVDLVYSYQENYTATIELPDNAVILEKPKQTEINTNNFLLTYQFLQDEKNVIVNCSYLLKKPVYSANDYLKLQEFMDKVIFALNQKIQIQIPHK